MNFTDFITNNGKRVNKDHFITLIQVCRIDGKISATELEMLHKEGKKFGLTDPEIDKLIESESHHHYHTPYSLDEKFDQIYNVGVMILADGIVTDGEKRALKRIAIEAGLNDDFIERFRPILIEGIMNNESEEALLAKFRSELFNR